MKRISQSLGLGLALLAASSVSPRAADWAVGSGGVIKDFGSVKDYRNAAVPVPAPTPAPSYNRDWYVRGDFGYNLATSADITASDGIKAGENMDGFLFGSIGAGRYLTPSIRAEMTFDFRPKKKVTEGAHNFDRKVILTGNNGTNPTHDTYTYQVQQTENSTTADQTAFFNLYYDFLQGPSSRIKPYVGAGLGLDYRRFKRETGQNANCYNVSSRDDGTGVVTPYDYSGGVGSLGVPGSCNVGNTTASDAKYTSAVGFAAALMLGVGVEVTPAITWDTGYRMIWQGASVSLAAASFDGVNTNINISDRIDHELRTGIRVDLN